MAGEAVASFQAHQIPPTVAASISSRIHGRRLGLPVRAGHSNIAADPAPRREQRKPEKALNLPSSISSILHLNLDTHLPTNLLSVLHLSGNDHRSPKDDVLSHYLKNTPTASPKENIAAIWREIHGARDWAGLLDPHHSWLRREIVKYGEFAQATYDAFDDDRFSRYCGSCRFGRSRLFSQLGLAHNGYEVTRYLYAMSHVEMPTWVERSLHAETWSKDSNWMGYVAVSSDEETRRIGRRDIVVAWRGTVTATEWSKDLQQRLEPLHDAGGKLHHDHHKDVVKVEHGFRSLYTSKAESTRYNKTSASEQVMEEIRRLVKMYSNRGEEVSLTVTGHSLGGALALLNAHEAAAGGIPGLSHVSVVSFGAPRVGNAAFVGELEELGVKVLRVVNQQDLVPRLPGAFFNEDLGKIFPVESLDWVYSHAGVELEVDTTSSPYLKQSMTDLPAFHSLETYLHLVDGLGSVVGAFRREARRDVALVNKACGLLRDELKIPACWYQPSNKGLVRNAHGRWVVPERDPEDIPSPLRHRAPAPSPSRSPNSQGAVPYLVAA
ncbi:unnamed protein product [Spirodela intermedia]|uniref:Fungal lipase-type domain-containing protein n=1 Tax=Spirodela intermedia TaxID=51605 RepID=A0A7I8LJ21_SPIIN|nr:unnamed protein product [Spirodela intermedia]